MQTLKYLAIGLCLLVLPGGCVPPQLVGDVEALKRSSREQQLENERLRVLAQRLAAQLETLDRSLWSERLCKSSKFSTQVAEFIGQVQAARPDVCTSGSLENAMMFLRTQAYANSIFRPLEKVGDMHIARREYLIDLLAPKNLHPSTRILVLVQPADETSADSRAALNLGEKFVEMLRDEIAPKQELRILGPHLLPCRVRKEVLRLFNGAMDATLPTEPKEGTPRIRIWTFITNC